MTELRPLALVVSLFAASGAVADSDTYYCTSPGYLAYELREWSAPEKRHVLKIVFVGGAEGISEPRTVPLEDFQLHGMKCESDRIEIIGWDRKYTIALPALQITSESKEAGAPPKEYQVQSFLLTRRTRSIAVASPDTERRYVLRIAYTEEKRPGVIHHRTETTLLERDARGKVLRRKPIHRGVSEETID